MANAPSPFLKALVNNFGCQGCYGIEWVENDGIIECKNYYNPEWRVDQVKSKGLEGLYTTQSTKFNFGIGQGLVGQVFQQKTLLFARDVQDLTFDGIAAAIQGWDSLEFARADLAKDYNICSAVFMPTATGVLEFGSTSKASSLPHFYSNEAKALIEGNHSPIFIVEWEERDGTVVPVGHYAPEVPAACQLESTLYRMVASESSPLVKAMHERHVVMNAGEHTLSKLFGLKPNTDKQAVFWPVPGTRRVIEVAFAPTANDIGKGMLPNVCSSILSTACKLLKAPIALEWRPVGDVVVCMGHYNSEERIAICDDKFGGTRYTLESYKFSFKPGAGVVGRIYASGVSELIPDLLQMPPDAYKRAKLAEKFDVRTAVFLAVKGEDGKVESVLEICTNQVCQQFDADFLKADALPANVQSELSTLAGPGMNSIY